MRNRTSRRPIALALATMLLASCGGGSPDAAEPPGVAAGTASASPSPARPPSPVASAPADPAPSPTTPTDAPRSTAPEAGQIEPYVVGGIDLANFAWDVCGSRVDDPDIEAVRSDDPEFGTALELVPPDVRFGYAGVRLDTNAVGDVTGDGVDDVVVRTYCIGASGAPWNLAVLAGGEEAVQLPDVFGVVDSATNLLEELEVVDGVVRLVRLVDPDAECRACAEPDTLVTTEHRFDGGEWSSTETERVPPTV